ncbi:hypothetical protein GCM10023083_53970 [Streptomyces phyllanthi]
MVRQGRAFVDDGHATDHDEVRDGGDVQDQGVEGHAPPAVLQKQQKARDETPDRTPAPVEGRHYARDDPGDEAAQVSQVFVPR